ncbi:ATP-binding cassette domain-containing protein, partial [Desulfovibrio sp. OttesenSCG-928-M14]|nr:ATP-binding cassette domain-containing protein [Desulfovibrio sp. OttesenSCG-928-M14]
MPSPLQTDFSKALVRLRNVDVAYGSHEPVFRGLNLDIMVGGHLALIGANGSGKSTLLRLLHGDQRPLQKPDGQSAGSICWYANGREENSALAARAMARLVSPDQQRNYMRQGWKLSGEEILVSGLDNAVMVYGEVSSALYQRAQALAEQAGALPLLGLTAPAMSQGQLRLLLVLRALMSQPALLLLDEPLDGLDAPARKAVFQALELAADRGATMVVSAHRQADIPPQITAALLVENGAVRSVPLLAESSSFAAIPPKEHLTAPFVPKAPSDSAPLLELVHVDVFIDRRKVLCDLNWRVDTGQQWRISGGNGAGKSTLLRLLYGEEFAAYGGTLLWHGKPRPALDELRASIGFVSDRLQADYADNLSAEEVVISGLSGSIGLYHEASEAERTLALAWLKHLGVARYAARPFHSLSFGNARRVLLARALAA